MAGVEDDAITRAVEDAVQGHGELHHAKVRAQVATGARHGVDEKLPDLGAEPLEVGISEVAEVGWSCDLLEKHLAILATPSAPDRRRSRRLRRGMIDVVPTTT